MIAVGSPPLDPSSGRIGERFEGQGEPMTLLPASFHRIRFGDGEYPRFNQFADDVLCAKHPNIAEDPVKNRGPSGIFMGEAVIRRSRSR